MRNVSIIKGYIINVLDVRTDASIKSSPKRLIEGGALIFAAAARNHQRVIDGRSLIIPLVKKRLRVLVVWYERFANTKSMGEISPWASIVVRAPAQPRVVIEVIAARKRPMWATDE